MDDLGMFVIGAVLLVLMAFVVYLVFTAMYFVVITLHHLCGIYSAWLGG